MSDALWQVVHQEVEEESEGPEEDSNKEEPPAKLPKLYSDDNVQALMRRGLPLFVLKESVDQKKGKEATQAAETFGFEDKPKHISISSPRHPVHEDRAHSETVCNGQQGKSSGGG